MTIPPMLGLEAPRYMMEDDLYMHMLEQKYKPEGQDGNANTKQ